MTKVATTSELGRLGTRLGAPCRCGGPYWVVGALSALLACQRAAISPDLCPAGDCGAQGCSAPRSCDAETDEPGTVARDCPLGSSCVAQQCTVVPFPRMSDSALLDGFNVAEFALKEVTTDPPELAWVTPPGVRRVVCALFVSPPEFASDGVDGDTQLTRIANSVRSIARQRVFNTEGASVEQSFSFELGELEPAWLRREDSDAAPCPPPMPLAGGLPTRAYPIVELLRVGCWGFDTAKVVAGTRLLSVAPSRLPDTNATPTQGCQGQPEGTWCRMPDAPGSCQQGRCDVQRPKPEGAQSGPTDGGASPPLAPTDCTGLSDDSACRQPSEAVGQCLDDACLARDDSYQRPLVVNQCREEMGDDGLNCYPTAILGFGNCLAGSCALRCREPLDCTDALRRAGLEAASTLRWSCERSVGYLGLCRQEKP
jgi:hypothetical protein